MPLMQRVCPGNQLVVGEIDPVTNTREYKIVWRHYKNKDKGGYTGSAHLREHTSVMHGPLWQSLQGHWQRWGRAEFMRLCNVPVEDDPGYTYLDRSGRPWRSVETDKGHSSLSTFVREQLLKICSASERFTEEELASLSTFTLAEARFTFIQHIERTLFKKCTQEEKATIKRDLCLCMLTSEEEWDKTYAKHILEIKCTYMCNLHPDTLVTLTEIHTKLYRRNSESPIVVYNYIKYCFYTVT